MLERRGKDVKERFKIELGTFAPLTVVLTLKFNYPHNLQKKKQDVPISTKTNYPTVISNVPICNNKIIAHNDFLPK